MQQQQQQQLEANYGPGNRGNDLYLPPNSRLFCQTFHHSSAREHNGSCTVQKQRKKERKKAK